jgi:hypothetical protein
MRSTRTVLDFTFAGVILGIVVASLAVPPILIWYNTPGNISSGKPIETLCDIPSLIRYATGRLMRWQAIAAGVGATLFFLIGLLARGRSSGANLPTEIP